MLIGSTLRYGLVPSPGRLSWACPRATGRVESSPRMGEPVESSARYRQEMGHGTRSVMPDETSEDGVGADQVLQTELIDLDGIMLAEVRNLGRSALGRTLSRILTDTGEQVASFESSL